ncbi:Beta-glucosidase 17 [Abeliophyllum distichum]|uniref:Beta-glucosidase 17 n=1 Tax=Abeliophyllum distichum TaxID=126358 RepID=A0ABD1RSU3_9LAMI
MELQHYPFLCLFVLVNFLCLNLLSVSAKNVPSTHISTPFNRTSFPSDFVFGASSSAYQYEGAVKEDGKGQSISDTFTHKYPGKILDKSTGDLANDFYHRYKEDVKLMEFIGLNGFRFSISWTRILPYGKLSKGVNKEGVAFYNNLINELISKGVQPFVTIYHWDLPQALQDEYGGFLSPRVVDDFRDFAEVCFKEFGDRVKHWVTMNEPYIFIVNGYDTGALAPGRCSSWMNNNCPAGNSATEPYIAAHFMLLCHAQTVKLYREKYKPHQKGQIGIVLVSHWFEPYSKSQADVKAAQRALDFMYGWFLEPLTYGDYPKIIRALVGKRLPKFTVEEATLVKGSYDFLGLNYYTSNYAANRPSVNTVNVSFSTDSQTNLTTERNGKFIGEPTGVSIFYVYPRGLKNLLVYTKQKYKNPTIYIMENGIGDANITTIKQGTNDPQRVDFYRRHFLAVKQAITEGVDVKGFLIWSFLDNFEWGSGYLQKFGIVYVDRTHGLKRYPKKSALWFKKFLR